MTERRECKNVVDAKAAGSYIIVELLDAQEILNTMITVSHAKIETPQAYVVDIGPSLDTSKWGVKVGDRVVLSTPAFVPLPKKEGGRQRGVVDVSAIRAVLVEGDEVQRKPSGLIV